MRRSQFTESEILHLLHEASTGVSVAEICRTAAVTPRTFYRWRRRFGGLSLPAVMQMKDLAAENHRLRGLVSSLIERLRAENETHEPVTTLPKSRDKDSRTATCHRDCSGKMRRRAYRPLRIGAGQSVGDEGILSVGSDNVKNDIKAERLMLDRTGRDGGSSKSTMKSLRPAGKRQ